MKETSALDMTQYFNATGAEANGQHKDALLDHEVFKESGGWGERLRDTCFRSNDETEIVCERVRSAAVLLVCRKLGLSLPSTQVGRLFHGAPGFGKVIYELLWVRSTLFRGGKLSYRYRLANQYVLLRWKAA